MDFFGFKDDAFSKQVIASENFLPQQINNNINNQILLEFHDKSVNSQQFIYSNNNQTISYKSKDNNFNEF